MQCYEVEGKDLHTVLLALAAWTTTHVGLIVSNVILCNDNNGCWCGTIYYWE
jgi:hypothetical protein